MARRGALRGGDSAGEHRRQPRELHTICAAPAAGGSAKVPGSRSAKNVAGYAPGAPAGSTFGVARTIREPRSESAEDRKPANSWQALRISVLCGRGSRDERAVGKGPEPSAGSDARAPRVGIVRGGQKVERTGAIESQRTTLDDEAATSRRHRFYLAADVALDRPAGSGGGPILSGSFPLSESRNSSKSSRSSKVRRSSE